MVTTGRAASDVAPGRSDHRSRRRRSVVVDVGLQPLAIRLAVDDQVVRIVLESIDSALREKRVVEDGEPIGGVAIARDDRRGAPLRSMKS